MDTVLPAAPPSTEISMVASGQGKSDLPGRNVVLNAKLRLRIWFKLWENGSMQVTGVEWLKAREWLRQYKPEPPRRQSHTATNRKTTTGGNLITIFQKGRLTLKNIDNLSISLTWFQVQFKKQIVETKICGPGQTVKQQNQAWLNRSHNQSKDTFCCFCRVLYNPRDNFSSSGIFPSSTRCISSLTCLTQIKMKHGTSYLLVPWFSTWENP